MTNEEFERAIEFLTESQAQFAANQAEYQAQAAANKAESDARMARIEAKHEELATTTQIMAKLVLSISDAQDRSDKRAYETNDRLDKFIVVLERYISGNGK